MTHSHTEEKNNLL